ncbi:MAG: type II secretion system F family protein [Clostridia bacterium]
MYKYVVEDKSGMVFKGTINADSRELALAKLPNYHKLLAFKDAGQAVELPPWLKNKLGFNKIPPKVIVAFFNQLAYMLKAGISYQKALLTLGSTGSDKSKILANRLLDQISEGKSLASAFTSCSDIIEDDYSKFIQVGDSAGNLPDTLVKLSEQIQSEIDVKAKVKSAMVYPVGVLAIALIAAYFVFTQIVPQVAALLKDMSGGELPTFTVIIMKISDFLVSYGPLAVFLILVTFKIISLIVHKFFQFQLDTFILKVPILGKINRTSSFIVFYQNLSFMMESGFPVNVAYQQSMDTILNKQLHKQLAYGYSKLIEGRALPQALSGLECIEPMEIQTIEIGQDSGRLGELMAIMLDNMKKDMDASIKALLSALEPLMMLVLIGVVAVLMLSVYGPLFSLMEM